MVTIKLFGRVLPFGLNIGATAPEISWKWGEENIILIFRVKIINSEITVDCDLDKYETRYNSELHKRATDLSRACVNMVAFATGYGLSTIVEIIELPDGSRVALHRRAVTSNHTAAADCGRVLDRIRRIIVPTLDGATAWQEMHKALNVSREYQEWVSKRSTGNRHGDSTFVSGAVNSEVIKRTWTIFNRFLEYRKRGNQPLTPPDFPQLI